MKLISFLNTGNTCYINSVFQCFVNDIVFRNVIMRSDNSKEYYTILKTIIELINLKEDLKSSFIKFNLEKFNELLFKNSYFTRFEQHDAHEFLLKFMDIFETECKEVYYGKTKLSIKCNKCNTTKEVFEDFTTLNLNVHLNDSEKQLHLYELFEYYLKREIHNDQNNLYYCDTCKCNTTSEQKTVLWKLPKRLIIVFKRYSDNGIKNNNKIKYPINNVLIKESSSNTVFNYSLSNIIYHFGHINHGHYTNSTKINDKWYLIDDDSITENSEIILNNPNSYILVYSAKDTPGTNLPL